MKPVINPEWQALENQPHLVPLCCVPGQYDVVKVGPVAFSQEVKSLIMQLNAPEAQRILHELNTGARCKTCVPCVKGTCTCKVIDV